MKDKMLMSNCKTIEKDDLLMQEDIIQVLSIIKSHRDNAYRKANKEQIMAYFELGKFLSNKIKELRTEHISWWSQEDITNHDVDNAIWNLKRYNNKVDFVLTHCVDSQTVKDAFHFRSDKSTDQLMFVDKIVNYKKWYFGHYHFDATISEQKECIYQKIINLHRKENI